MTLRSVGTWLAAMLAALLFAAPANANHTGVGGWSAHWPGPNGETWINVYESWDDGRGPRGVYWRYYYQQAIDKWNSSPYVHFNRVGEGQDPYTCRAQYRGIHLCQGWYAASWAGLWELVYRWDTGHAEVGRILLDDYPYAYNYQISNGTCRYADGATCGQALKHTECHELGHGLGLGHDSWGCMASGAPRYTTPRSHDYDMVAWLMGHGESSYGNYVYRSGNVQADAVAEELAPPTEIESPQEKERKAVKDKASRDNKLDDKDLPPRGSCRPRKVDERLFLERVCRRGEPVDDNLVVLRKYDMPVE